MSIRHSTQKTSDSTHIYQTKRSTEKACAIVVVNYNTCSHLRACLDSISAVLMGEVIVVDNASTDGSVQMVRREFPSVQLICNTVNIGYGAAVNQAVAQSDAFWILLLNSDTRLDENIFATLQSYIDTNPRAAIIGPRIINIDGSLQPSCYLFPTLLHVFLEESTLGRWVYRLPFIRSRCLRAWAHDAARQVPWVLGATLLLRREAFDSVDGFDPAFFLYAEEIDLSYRLKQVGWETHFTPDTTVTHIGGATTRQYRTAMAVQFFASLQRFYRKHYSRPQLILLNCLIGVIIALRLLRDRILLMSARDKKRRLELSHCIEAWRQILRGITRFGLITDAAESNSRAAVNGTI